MADVFNFDLLAEIEELSNNGNGKMAPLGCINGDEGDGGAEGGLPSQCVSDEFILEPLLGDPFLPLLQDPMMPPLSPQPAYPQPETLIQVSLPAGQPAVHDPATSPPPSPQPEVTAPSPPASPAVSEPSSVSPAKPVRVVVRTGKMVAPVNLEKPSRYLVRIPGTSAPVPVNTRGRKHSLHEEKPHQDTNTTSATPTTTTTTTTTCVPFRSLRNRTQGNAGCTRENTKPGRHSKRKAYELGPQDDPEMERCRMNAINARRNRELKKARVADLERRLEEGDRECDRLRGENRELKEGMARLQRQVGHLTSVLRNDSRLSNILDKVSPMRLSLGDPAPLQEENEDLPGGVCLHLDGKEATLEFCSLCAKKASKKMRS